MQTNPLSLPLQARHVLPFAPHAVLTRPATHVPFAQQPPLHGLPGPQLVVHCWVISSHARLAGQSTWLTQPHCALPPTVTQALPTTLPAHEPHTAPPSAHAVCVLPATHELFEQQPPLHGVLASHAVPHTPALHAPPCGQSADFAQPHTPFAHVGPFGLLVQSAHA